jgi:hypothetical protein
VKVLTTLCEQIEGIPISGIIVVGDGQAARSIALSGNAMKVPVLWAKGGTAQLQESSEVSESCKGYNNNDNVVVGRHKTLILCSFLGEMRFLLTKICICVGMKYCR